MNLSSPINIIAAWVIYPCIVALISAGNGLLLERAAGRRFGILALPYGFVAVLVAYAFLIQVTFPANAVSVIVALGAVAGIALRVARPREGERGFSEFLRSPSSGAVWACVAAVAIYALAMLPLVATGRLGILGYYFLNDPSWHTGLIEWLHAHGARSSGVHDSSWSMISRQISQGYPLGTYSWPLIGMTFTGATALALWTPTCAITLAMLGILIHRFVRQTGATPPWAAAFALVISTGYLVSSYYVQGGLKELVFAFALSCSAYAIATIEFGDKKTLAGQWRAMLPAAFAIAALAVIFGPGAGAWAGQMVLLVVICALIWPGSLTRGRVLALTVVWGLTALVFALPSIVAALNQLGTVSFVAGNAGGIGNLLGPVPIRETLGAWISPDYRLTEPTPAFHDWSYVLSAVAGLLVVIGGIRELRERRWFVPLAGFAGFTAILYLERKYNVYFQAKGYVAFAPIVGCAIASGIVWLVLSNRRRKILGVVLAGAFVFSWIVGGAAIYAHVFTTPTERLEELATLNKKIAGKGPTLVVDREEYGEYLLRDGKGFQPFAMFTPFVELLPGGFPSPQIPPDVDGFQPKALHRFNAFVTRRSPAGSRPPSNFEVAAATKHYVLWHRTGSPPLLHVPNGIAVTGGSAPLACNRPAVRAAFSLAERRNKQMNLALPAPGVKYVPAANINRAGEWAKVMPDVDGFVGRAGTMAGSLDAPLQAGQHYEVWVQGAFAPGIVASVSGKEIGRASRDLASPEQWISLGTITATGPTTMRIDPASTSSLSPGSQLADRMRAFAFSPLGAKEQVISVSPTEARKYCGEPVDWIEVAS